MSADPRRVASPSGTGGTELLVAVTEDDVMCLRASLAELWIAVNETKVVKQDAERVSRLAQAQHLTDAWIKVFVQRKELARSESEVRRAR